jgi:nucleoside-diphosphate-sugar epimerase
MDINAKSADEFPNTEDELEELLSRPTAEVVSMMSRIPGDILVLGAGGKMGPSLTRMAKRASDLAGSKRRVIAVSRFKESVIKSQLEDWGIETIATDILQPGALEALPDAPNIIYMAGMKFGATGQEPLTWAMNALLPGLVCRRYPTSRIAAFSTGNVYGPVSVESMGSKESDPLAPVGEYAQSCLGRERIFQYAALSQETKVAMIRLNYACDLRYGVLVDIADRVKNEKDLDITVNAFNIIWQGDANALSLLCLERASCPAFIVNITGREKLYVDKIANEYASLFKKKLKIIGKQTDKALLSDASQIINATQYALKESGQMVKWVGDWFNRGGRYLGKDTGFEKLHGFF